MARIFGQALMNCTLVRPKSRSHATAGIDRRSGGRERTPARRSAVSRLGTAIALALNSFQRRPLFASQEEDRRGQHLRYSRRSARASRDLPFGRCRSHELRMLLHDGKHAKFRGERRASTPNGRWRPDCLTTPRSGGSPCWPGSEKTLEANDRLWPPLSGPPEISRTFVRLDWIERFFSLLCLRLQLLEPIQHDVQIRIDRQVHPVLSTFGPGDGNARSAARCRFSDHDEVFSVGKDIEGCRIVHLQFEELASPPRAKFRLEQKGNLDQMLAPEVVEAPTIG